jgi:hypothetical protein
MRSNFTLEVIRLGKLAAYKATRIQPMKTVYIAQVFHKLTTTLLVSLSAAKIKTLSVKVKQTFTSLSAWCNSL